MRLGLSTDETWSSVASTTCAVCSGVKTWPAHRQEDAARTLLHMEEIGLDIYELTPEEEAEIDEAEASGVPQHRPHLPR